MSKDQLKIELLDISRDRPRHPEPWEPLLVPKEIIDTEIERLADSPASTNGRRSTSFCHPQSVGGIRSFTPGTRVTLEVLKPGECTLERRSIANQIEISIQGSGLVQAGHGLNAEQFDVWTIPPMTVYNHRNNYNELWVRLCYSNAPLLERLGTLFEEEGGDLSADKGVAETVSPQLKEGYSRQTAPDLPIGHDGARLRGYEFLTDIQVVESKPLIWPWKEIAPHLQLKKGDNGRIIWLMYNPATESRAGTSASYFATYAATPPGGPPFKGERGHRHISASINYHTRGYGKSVVDGVAVEWKEGDLLYSAPGWREHAHYWEIDGWTVITVQDHPTHIALGSLLWQEDMEGPIYALGLQPGQKGYVGPRERGH
jgi:gentisate 1,2-dioxygenase